MSMDPAVTVTIPVGAVGIDFSSGQPAAWYLKEHGISFVMMYLKYWDAKYAKLLMDNGIAVGAIQESAGTSALLGASEGMRQARYALTICRQQGIPIGHPVMFTHDTSKLTEKVGEFFKAAHDTMRWNRYGFAGYVTKSAYEMALRHGVTFDQTVCPGGYAMNGDRVRSVDANSWQHPGSTTFLPGFSVDKQDVKRPMQLWGIPSAQPPTPSQPANTPLGRDDMKDIVTNAETRTNQFDGQSYPKQKFIFVVEEGGLLRHVDGRLPEGRLYGDPAVKGYEQFSNAELDAWPKYVPPAPVVYPFGVSGSFQGTVS